MKKIEAEYTWDAPEGASEIDHSERDEIAALLEGRSVVEVDGDHLKLDDGRVVKVIPNQGGCSCGAGDYDLSALNRVDNVITSVEFEYAPSEDGTPFEETPGHYSIFVLAGDERINLLRVEGDDGNGYYGTGFRLLVRA